jgi:Ca2+-transporting ATPase
MLAQTRTEQELPWHVQPGEAVLDRLGVDPARGLDNNEATRRLMQFGPNELQDRGRKAPWLILWEQFTSTMVLILIAAAAVSAVLGKPLETAAISAIVVLFALLGFVQEYRAEQAMAALKKLSAPMVRVRRNGQEVQLPAQSLVPGDIVLLEAGNLVPADLRLIESVNLRLLEAALTGESEPVEKHSAPLANPALTLGDRTNMAYLGTQVAYGRGTGVVVATGMTTELGRIADLIQEVEQKPTPLQQQLDQVGKSLALGGAIVAGLVLLIGAVRGEPVSDMFLTAVSVAVAVVPEGLPAVVTVTLALGAQRMLRRRALIRKLPAVETLGSVTVICSDKTGTLTENRMTVTVIDVAGHYLELAGTGRHPTPTLVSGQPTVDLLKAQPPSVGLVLAGGALCNDASLTPDPRTGRYIPVGDPTEGALLVAATQAGLTRAALEAFAPRVAEVPFDSERKRMTSVHRLPQDAADWPPALAPLRTLGTTHVAFTKGAVDGLLDISSRVWDGNGAVPLDAHWRERIQVASDDLALKGMRVLGLALRPLPSAPPANGHDLERDLIFVGLIGMIDPPRPEVRQAIATCREAGIRPIMITGDHPLTARFIAYDLGITTDGRVKTGQDLDRMSPEELSAAVREVSVFARVTPEHKLRIVEALQRQNQVVAMTGDGVNDSPALRKADIGVAMGIAGTDVSKEAAQMVLLDDNFATIVAAVEEGRATYDNIRRFVKFSIAGTVGKVIVMLFAPLFGISVALLPLQLLWLNLLTDGLLGLGMGMEPADRRIMQRPPRAPGESLFSAGLRRHVLWVGTLIGSLALGIGAAFYHIGESEQRTWQTMIFTSLAFLQIGQALASRSTETSFLALGVRSNPTLLAMVVIVVALQLIAIYAPFLDEFFRVTPLNAAELALCVGLGGVVFAAIEIEKWLLRKRERTLH